ncbi:acyl-CoA carboxylase subunit epsilon [Jiangella gansuensis]|uniref:acyl-CoA carboxylase subunit epsilon n=1 Tax=Jiangella gansuensis TaxID=281473 RepID=UPI00047C4F6E|nr:acyl-CoA carboxylase subunit epsilon [Jiangella gansuensis]
MDDPTTQPRPVLRVVRGNPTDEELAALLVVLAARTAAAPAQPAPGRSAWASYWSRNRAPLTAGSGAWRASALPR